MSYAMSFGWLGGLVNRWLIANRLERIVYTRRDDLQARWKSSHAAHCRVP